MLMRGTMGAWPKGYWFAAAERMAVGVQQVSGGDMGLGNVEVGQAAQQRSEWGQGAGILYRPRDEGVTSC